MGKPTLCWECRRKRVLHGLANARAKGVRIGRERKRNSALIESLLEAGLSYREIARIAKCSHGSVHAQRVEHTAKKVAAEKLKQAELEKSLEFAAGEPTAVQSEADKALLPSIPPSV